MFLRVPNYIRRFLIFKMIIYKTMIKLLGALSFVFLFFGSSYAQTFEGIVVLRQVSGEGFTNDLTWYIKKDKIAFEIINLSETGTMKMRFVPKPKQNSMLMVINTTQGETKNEISASEISSDIDMSKSEVKDNGVKNSAEYGELNMMTISTPNTVTESEIDKSIDVDLSKYVAFLKNDYAIQALIKTKQIGFPLNSVTKDKSGNLISKISVISVKRTAVSDNFFN
jgi:hypothetical protein